MGAVIVLIAWAPARVSFFGGGSDLPVHYLRHGSAVGQHERRFAPEVTHGRIKSWYALARDHGASGGKIAGVGGGFLMLYCEGGATSTVETVLKAKSLHCLEYEFEPDSGRVLLNMGRPLQANRTPVGGC